MSLAGISDRVLREEHLLDESRFALAERATEEVSGRTERVLLHAPAMCEAEQTAAAMNDVNPLHPPLSTHTTT